MFWMRLSRSMGQPLFFYRQEQALTLLFLNLPSALQGFNSPEF